jgi:hypothetical protein
MEQTLAPWSDIPIEMAEELVPGYPLLTTRMFGKSARDGALSISQRSMERGTKYTQC